MDLALPASTNVPDVVYQMKTALRSKKKGMKVIFWTYQSIDVIIEAQRQVSRAEDGYGDFGLSFVMRHNEQQA